MEFLFSIRIWFVEFNKNKYRLSIAKENRISEVLLEQFQKKKQKTKKIYIY